MVRSCTIFSLCLVIVGRQTTQLKVNTYDSEVPYVKMDSRGVLDPVITLVASPENLQSLFPGVVAQHGSKRDDIRFPGGAGYADEYSTRSTDESVKRGFSVIDIDLLDNFRS